MIRDRLLPVRRLALWAGVIIPAVFILTGSPAWGASYTVPKVSRLIATLPPAPFVPEAHMLCEVRTDVTGAEAPTRAMCYTSYKPDAAPTLPISSLDPALHQLAAGDFNSATGVLTLHAQPCVAWLNAFAIKIDLVIHLSKGASTPVTEPQGVVLTADTAAPFNCAGPPAYGPLTLSPLAQNHDEDAFAAAAAGVYDGCTDFEELGTSKELGGLRDPFNPFDFYDIDNNKQITLFGDIFGVAAAFNQGPGSPNYTVAKDRGQPVGPNVWNLSGPDNIITLFGDVFWVESQFNHSCSAAPN